MFVEIDRNSSISIKKQLYDALTYKILNKELPAGHRMPSSRQLSDQLSIARNTVTEIYDQLVAESYLNTYQGRGTFVAQLGDCKISSSQKKDFSEKEDTSDKDIISLVAGRPDLESFPDKQWLKACRDVLETHSQRFFDYGETNGYTPFRKSLVKYLKYHKGIYCSYNQIIVTNGTKHAAYLIASALKHKYSKVMIESPAVDFIARTFHQNGYDVTAAPTDNNGMIVENLNESTPSLIYTSPAHQFPLGGTMPICRRQKLLDFAAANGHIVLEDDYDSEFRYKGAPVNSLYQLNSERVIHLGSFSKTLSPALRLGYIVVPDKLVDVFNVYQDSVGNPVNTLNQAALNELITSGVYESHIYKMTKVYKAKMKMLTQSLSDAFAESIIINGCAIGLHISVEFTDIMFNIKNKEIFRDNGLDIELTSEYNVDKPSSSCNSLIIGFGHLNTEQIQQAIQRLKKAIDDIKRKN
ncbi:MAG: PLP-dependent aminotransferase family protein [Clostridia bacterium]|nr:PLP-dependent aminotransferase family protein [Clostridia bacterium]